MNSVKILLMVIMTVHKVYSINFSDAIMDMNIELNTIQTIKKLIYKRFEEINNILELKKSNLLLLRSNTLQGQKDKTTDTGNEDEGNKTNEVEKDIIKEEEENIKGLKNDKLILELEIKKLLNHESGLRDTRQLMIQELNKEKLLNNDYNRNNNRLLTTPEPDNNMTENEEEASKESKPFNPHELNIEKLLEVLEDNRRDEEENTVDVENIEDNEENKEYEGYKSTEIDDIVSQEVVKEIGGCKTKLNGNLSKSEDDIISVVSYGDHKDNIGTKDLEDSRVKVDEGTNNTTTNNSNSISSNLRNTNSSKNKDTNIEIKEKENNSDTKDKEEKNKKGVKNIKEQENNKTIENKEEEIKLDDYDKWIKTVELLDEKSRHEIIRRETRRGRELYEINRELIVIDDWLSILKGEELRLHESWMKIMKEINREERKLEELFNKLKYSTSSKNKDTNIEIKDNINKDKREVDKTKSNIISVSKTNEIDIGYELKELKIDILYVQKKILYYETALLDKIKYQIENDYKREIKFRELKKLEEREDEWLTKYKDLIISSNMSNMLFDNRERKDNIKLAEENRKTKRKERKEYKRKIDIWDIKLIEDNNSSGNIIEKNEKEEHARLEREKREKEERERNKDKEIERDDRVFKGIELIKKKIRGDINENKEEDKDIIKEEVMGAIAKEEQESIGNYKEKKVNKRILSEEELDEMLAIQLTMEDIENSRIIEGTKEEREEFNKDNELELKKFNEIKRELDKEKDRISKDRHICYLEDDLKNIRDTQEELVRLLRSKKQKKISLEMECTDDELSRKEKIMLDYVIKKIKEEKRIIKEQIKWLEKEEQEIVNKLRHLRI